jgi:hypothetical protein
VSAEAPKGIPTKYAGVQFRSRLEARWAALFDLWGWAWLYEPLDLDGYIPDFILTDANNGEGVLVEVKPAITRETLRACTLKIERSGWRGDALVVGARLFETEDWSDFQSLGLLGEFGDYDRGATFGWGDAPLFSCQHCRGVNFHHSIHSFGWRMPDTCERSWKDSLPLDFINHWNYAGNAVQWRGPLVVR